MKALMKASVVALAALWAGIALAQNPGTSGRASHMDNLAVLLDLTDTQKGQVQTILQGEHAQMKALFEQAKAAGGKPDFQAMHAAHQQIAQDTLTKLSTVLSPTQVKKFQTLQQMHHGFGHHGGPDGRGGPGGPPPAAAPSQN
jgi:Spy/CpxP family protein refolding chaperone